MRPYGPHLGRLERRLRAQRARLLQLAQAEPRRRQHHPAEQPAAGEPGTPQLERALRVLCCRPELLEVTVAVRQLVGELRLVEEPRPVGRVVAGARRLQRPFRPRERGRARPYLGQYAVSARLRRVQQGLDDGRRVAADALLGDPGQLDGFPPVPQVDGLPAHGHQDVRAVRAIPGRLRQPQRLDEVPLRQAVRGDVVRRPAGQPRQVGGGREQPPPGRLAVRAAEHRFDLVLQVAHQRLARVPAAVRVVQRPEQFADRPERLDVTGGHPVGVRPVGAFRALRALGALRAPGAFGGSRALRPFGMAGAVVAGPVHLPLPGHRHLHPARRGQPARGLGRVTVRDPLVGPSDQPVAAGHHQPGRGEGDLAQLRVAAGVLAPQTADDVHRLARRGRELQPGVHRRAGVQAEVLGRQPASQSAREDLGDQCGRGASGLLPA